MSAWMRTTPWLWLLLAALPAAGQDFTANKVAAGSPTADGGHFHFTQQTPDDIQRRSNFVGVSPVAIKALTGTSDPAERITLSWTTLSGDTSTVRLDADKSMLP